MNLVEKAFGAYLRLHDTVYQRTNGWIGHRMMLLPSLLLHGRRQDRQGPHHISDVRPGR